MVSLSTALCAILLLLGLGLLAVHAAAHCPAFFNPCYDAAGTREFCCKSAQNGLAAQTYDCSSSCPQAYVAGRYFDRIFTIIFENTDYAAAIADPYFVSLTRRGDGRLLTNYHGCTHPSLPNYLCQSSGTFYGHTSDAVLAINGTSVVDLLEPAGISWKAYMEAFNGNCDLTPFTPADGNGYARKHDPFLNIANIINNPARCAKVVPAAQLDADISAGTVPQYAYYVPTQRKLERGCRLFRNVIAVVFIIFFSFEINDAHNSNTSFAAGYLKGFLEPKLADLNFYDARTLVVITFDENDFVEPTNRVYTVLLGKFLNADGQASNDSSCYNHAAELKTVEENWGLGNLGTADVAAKSFFSGVNQNNAWPTVVCAKAL
ncbi:acid phosphatase [Klebsormidium nitens]|uniref:Acid phosphatase n=1 Tax=Klebsormidium nitens TaxID=105231 RepID=A0A1Y1HTP2_KLENI|nr:acid phosphatase [Klebsormidium nitens]|eukprot:GAQ80549.1 acid phosphatase [Klebsormidium nitens]